VEIPAGLESLFLIVTVAAIAPLIVGRLPGPRIPEVVLLIVLGVVIGPQMLGIAENGSEIELIANVGLGFLFFLAGFELDRIALLGRPGRSAATVWLVGAVASLVIVGALWATGFVEAYLPVAIALTTTALGTLVPILRDTGDNRGAFGQAVMANGAIGELFPIIAISLFLSSRGAWESLAILALFATIAFLISRFAGRMKRHPLAHLVRGGAETTSQTTVRMTVLLLVGLLLLSGEFGLDVVLGAFAAGIVLRMTLPEGDRVLEHKLEGLAFGFFIPAFFVVSGMKLDVRSILENPAHLAVFFLLIMLVRGLPALVAYRRQLAGTEPLRLALYTATGLPLIVAICEIGLATGHMLPENAAALIGAGLLTVLAFPVLARVLSQREGDTPRAADGAAAGREPAGERT
jgi:Kef-type K+ transport system membrane component KefB